MPHAGVGGAGVDCIVIVIAIGIGIGDNIGTTIGTTIGRIRIPPHPLASHDDNVRRVNSHGRRHERRSVSPSNSPVGSTQRGG